MNVKELYEKIDGNYQEALSRLMKEERIVKYLNLFLKDKEYEQLKPAFDEKNYELVFRLSHTVKGMCSNMSFTRLFDSSSALCESVRYGTPENDITPLVEKFLADNKFTRDAIAEFIEGKAE